MLRLFPLNLKRRLNPFHAALGVEAGGLVLVLFVPDRFQHFIRDRLHVPLGCVVDRGSHCAAVRVAEHHDEADSEVGGGVFDRPELMVIDHVPGDPDHEDIADSAGKGDFGDRAGV